MKLFLHRYHHHGRPTSHHSANFLRKILTKSKFFLNGYLLTGEKEMPKCLSISTIVEGGLIYIDHSGRGELERKSEERRRRRRTKRRELVTWRVLCLSVQKSNVVSQKMHITCNYKRWEVHCSVLNSKGAMCKTRYRLTG